MHEDTSRRWALPCFSTVASYRMGPEKHIAPRTQPQNHCPKLLNGCPTRNKPSCPRPRLVCQAPVREGTALRPWRAELQIHTEGCSFLCGAPELFGVCLCIQTPALARASPHCPWAPDLLHPGIPLLWDGSSVPAMLCQPALC